jgi:hypothetical protein
MALATAPIIWKSRDNGQYTTERYPILSGTQLYEGQYVQLDSGGFLKPYAADAAGIAGARVLGRVLPTKKDVDAAIYLKGDTTLSPNPAAIVFTGSEILEGVSVVGAASQASVGLEVYLDATGTQGDRVFTTTSTTNGKQVGVITAWKGGTTCDIKIYSFQERLRA